MTSDRSETRWLNAEEGATWQSFVVGTLYLFSELEHGLLEAGDINHLDYGIMAQLSFRETKSVRMAELADIFGESRTLVSYRIKRLEQHGFVRRERDPIDGRGVLAFLTAEGTQLLDELAPAHVERVREYFLDYVTEDELPVIGAMFTRIRAAQAIRRHRTDGEG